MSILTAESDPGSNSSASFVEGESGGVETEYYIPYTYTMEDKYIGLALALGGTFLIGCVQSISITSLKS